MSVRILQGDCRAVMATLGADCIDAIVTDPPYHLTNNGGGPHGKGADNPYSRARAGASAGGFMGMKWDGGDVAFHVETWREALRVLKPGGYLLAFSGTRTYHRMVCAIEDAGFEIRDQIGWAYGSGFPKSLNVAKAVDSTLTIGGSSQAQMRKRDMGADYKPHRNAGTQGFGDGNLRKGADGDRDLTDAIDLQTEAARQWQGWGTALKPAWEPIVLARKPLIGTVAQNVLTHGTGALNIDACRVAVRADAAEHRQRRHADERRGPGVVTQPNEIGRWPANLIHDGSDEVLAAFPCTESGKQAAGGHVRHSDKTRNAYGAFEGQRCGGDVLYGDAGSAARFFYSAKADGCDRNDGLQGERNTHPTVKPTDLMRYLCRLVTPPGGTVLDPFMGSGSTLKAAELEGFSAIGIELEPAYIEIARRRIGADAPLFAEVEVA